MRYRLLGKSGLRVSEMCLGTMTFGEDWGFGASKEECQRQLAAFVERGGNFIDTANLYTNGSSEKIVGELVGEERERFVVATKYTLSSNPKDPNACGNHRKNMVQALEKSLKRLGMEYIDLLWVHAWDEMTPVDEMMRGLDDLVRAGKVLYVGVSDTPAWVVSQANTMAELRGWSRFVGLQIEYSLIQRTPEADLLPMARALDIAVTPWGAMGGGVLTGKYNKKAEGGEVDTRRAQGNQARLTERNLAIAAEVEKVAQEVGGTAAQVALGWVRQQAGTVIPVIGARTAAQLEDSLRCIDLTLSPEHMARLDEVSRVPHGFPHDFLARDNIRRVVHGDHWGRVVK
ncbi:MAG TPA: aldo/keto reductase [Candidatus Nanopelagicales bacterium]|nr:aldo/keto reductase [Candidatus Nanopelagicales bacterium]